MAQRYPTKEELEKLKKNDQTFYEKMGWSKQPEQKEVEKALPKLTEEQFLEKLN